MNWSAITSTAGRLVNAKLFELGGTTVTLGTILTVALIIVATYLASRVLRSALHRLFRRRGLTDDGNVLALLRLTHYAVLLVGIGVSLQTAGFRLNALFAAGAVFAIGIGFAMQNLVQNFVSGVLLLLERAIKPGDVLEVESRVVKVVQMGIRTTIVLTRDGESLIVPNSVLVQSTVTNYTFKDSMHRIRAKVGVVYGADMRLVLDTLRAVAESIDWRLPEHPPIVLLTDFGDNSVNFEVSVWIKDPWERPKRLSTLNEEIWWALKDKGIVIAFPQLDVHFDPPVEQGLAKLAAVR